MDDRQRRLSQYSHRGQRLEMLPEHAIDWVLSCQNPAAVEWIFLGRWVFLAKADEAKILVIVRWSRWWTRRFERSSDLAPTYTDPHPSEGRVLDSLHPRSNAIVRFVHRMHRSTRFAESIPSATIDWTRGGLAGPPAVRLLRNVCRSTAR